MTVTLPEALAEELYEPLRDMPEYRACITTALAALDKRRTLVDKCWKYFDGDHDSLWLTSKLREVFGPQFDTKLEDNYCELAVEAVVLRLSVDGWQEVAPGKTDAEGDERDGGSTAVQAVQTLMDANGLDLEQEELYRAAGAAGQAYLMTWPRYVDNPDDPQDGTQEVAEDGTPLYDITLQDARNVYVHTGTSSRDRRYAVKVWRDSAAKRWRATVYFPDEVVRTRTLEGSTGATPPKASRFLLDTDDPGGENPVGAVPFFRFARDRRGRSRLLSLAPIQDKINKLSIGKMVAAEFTALKQRYALLGEDVPDHVLKAVPGSVWKLPAGGPTEDDPSNPRTQVGEFSAADLSQFDSAKREEVDAFLTIGMLPRNLRASAGGQASSGEQVTKDSGPFISLVEDHQDMYGGAWRDLWEALGYAVKPAWSPAQFANAKDRAEEVKTYRDAGVPLEAALAWTGRTADEIEEVRRLLDEEANRSATAAARAVTALDQGTDALTLLREGMGGAPAPGAMDPAAAKAAFDALGVAIRSGVDPEEAARRVGLGGIRFTGATPASLRLPKDDAAELEAQ